MKRNISSGIYFLFVFLLLNGITRAQSDGSQPDYLSYSWRKVATQMPAGWYGSAEARRVAGTVLYFQMDAGGWAKNKPYHHTMTAADTAEFRKNRDGIGATIDNGSTTSEMIFLAQMYQQIKDEHYANAFEKALKYLLLSQYGNGGFPQFYPFRKGKTVSYAAHITYNDNAMVNVLRLLRDIAEGDTLYACLPLTETLKERARKAYNKGIDCIMETQIQVNRQPAVWCAQHDEVTLLPANARAYELASFSGQESVGIVQLLMEIPAPEERIIRSVKGAMRWFDEHKITGWKVENLPGPDGKKNIVLTADPAATPLLARFYDLDTGRPFFCDRDGVKRAALTDIGAERRNGYSWYNNGLEGLQKQYSGWLKKWNIHE